MVQADSLSSFKNVHAVHATLSGSGAVPGPLADDADAGPAEEPSSPEEGAGTASRSSPAPRAGFPGPQGTTDSRPPDSKPGIDAIGKSRPTVMGRGGNPADTANHSEQRTAEENREMRAIKGQEEHAASKLH